MYMCVYTYMFNSQTREFRMIKLDKKEQAFIQSINRMWYHRS